MADYDLSKLSPRDFEHLVQALATRVVGPGVTVFGDGPDGGREVTFTGRMDYPSQSEAWDGHLVIQCKAKVRPSGDPGTDGAWAAGQYKKELDAWLEKPRTRRPEYFIAATNVVLSPKADTGGKDKLVALLEEYAPKLGIKGYGIWDHDQIGRYLDAHADIRRAYAPFVMLGDVLHELATALGGEAPPDFEQTMAEFLQSELLADTYARIEQAGHTPEARAPLARVFTDIEATRFPVAEDKEMPGPGILVTLLEAASERLVPTGTREPDASVDEHGHTEVDGRDPAQGGRPARGRFVLVGGPGQGKSTIGQFLCQLHRAAILRDRPSLEEGARRTLEGILADAHSSQVMLPTARRFPLRVELSDLASKLAKGEADSLLTYVASLIRLRTGREVTVHLLRRWLGMHPWLLVLDGLDEVPATSNRTAVLRTITDFWVIGSEAKADLFVVATTRPQGYTGDFDEQLYDHRYLRHLSLKRALHYARRLCDVRFAHDKVRADLVYERLQEAASASQAVQKLLRTPLQVTMLAGLANASGSPPEQRWSLFSAYYRFIYVREAEKTNPASKLLQIHARDVEAIHRKVALHLHRTSELAGSTEAMLDVDTFRRIIERRLDSEGIEGIERTKLATDLVSAALDRLVLLVPVRAGQIGFELRPIQEFMAAEAMLAGSDTQVRARLLAMGRAPHWRQVLLFACAKCFGDVSTERFRDAVVDICAAADDPSVDESLAIVRAGSRLALDLLSEAVTRPGSKYHRLFLERALGLVNLPAESAHTRLAAAYDPTLAEAFRAALERVPGTGAWAVLFGLLERGHTSFETIANTRWSVEGRRADALRAAQEPLGSAWAIQKLIELLPGETPWQLASEIRLQPHVREKLPAWADAALRYTARNTPEDDASVRVRLGEVVLTLKHQGARRAWADEFFRLPEMPDGAAAWWPLREGVAFAVERTHGRLAEALENLAARWTLPDDGLFLGRLPWPLDACVRTGLNLVDLAQHARAGALGNAAVWELAEQRWSESELSEDELLGMTAERWPYDMNIAISGFPVLAFTPSFSNVESNAMVRALVMLHGQASAPLRPKLGDWLIQLLSRMGFDEERLTEPITPALLRTCIEESTERRVHMPMFAPFTWPMDMDAEWVGFFDWLGELKAHLQYYASGLSQTLTESLAGAFRREPKRCGLLQMLSLCALEGGHPQVDVAMLDPYLDDDADARLAEAALVVRLTTADWSDDVGRKLGRRVASLISEFPQLTDNIVHLFRMQKIPPDRGLPVILGLLDARPTVLGTNSFASVIAWCDKALRGGARMLSGAGDDDLGLPALDEE